MARKSQESHTDRQSLASAFRLHGPLKSPGLPPTKMLNRGARPLFLLIIVRVIRKLMVRRLLGMVV